MFETLAIFQKLFLYHVPCLCLFLMSLPYPPECYAIPWFLTMFSHVLPIEQIFLLWDSIIVHSNSIQMPFFVAVAIMKQIELGLEIQKRKNSDKELMESIKQRPEENGSSIKFTFFCYHCFNLTLFFLF